MVQLNDFKFNEVFQMQSKEEDEIKKLLEEKYGWKNLSRWINRF